VRDVRSYHFERDVAIVLDVVREVDRGHAARTKLACNTVAVR
jgi:hypothetical protein